MSWMLVLQLTILMFMAAASVGIAINIAKDAVIEINMKKEN